VSGLRPAPKGRHEKAQGETLGPVPIGVRALKGRHAVRPMHHAPPRECRLSHGSTASRFLVVNTMGTRILASDWACGDALSGLFFLG
jgi:hypothetical protein